MTKTRLTSANTRTMGSYSHIRSTNTRPTGMCYKPTRSTKTAYLIHYLPTERSRKVRIAEFWGINKSDAKRRFIEDITKSNEFNEKYGFPKKPFYCVTEVTEK